MSEQPAGGFGRMQEEMLARLNELMHSLLETNPLLQAARRADELPQPVRDLLHGLTGYAGLAVQPLSLFDCPRFWPAARQPLPRSRRQGAWRSLGCGHTVTTE